MKSGFSTIRTGMAEPEPPQPLPFPVRIIRDPRPPPPPSDLLNLPAVDPNATKTDYFYQAWDRFLSVQPRRAKRVSRAARKLEEEKIELATGPVAEGLKVKEDAATSWEQATAQCRAKVAAIVEECKRLNQKYRDAMFNPEATPYCFKSLTGLYPDAVEDVDAPPWVKRVEDIFDNPQFFIDGATPTDVHQGSGGDCWFLAALMAISAKKELIEDVCVARDEKIGVYGFVFYRDGEWIYEVIDDKLYMRVGDDDDISIVRDWHREKKEGTSLQHDEEKLKETLQRGGKALYFSHCKSDETWLPLIEKAYAKAHGDYFAIEGGSASEAIEDLTGGVAVVINPEDIMDKERFWREQLSQVNEKYLFGGGTQPTSSKGFVGGHAYTVLRTYEDGDLKLLKLRNPWGEVEWEGDWSDGSKKWTPELMIKLEHTFGDDGIFWISYKDFLKHFHHINRVRLFTKEWKVAQQWTCVNVPWTVDYLDTRFEITLNERGPLVIVLSQPDPRYFDGLVGRFVYSLHFRVYKEGSKHYLIRSMHNSGNGAVFTRSVSAELDDMEPGKYSVIFKVTAVRTTSPTAAEAIHKYALDRKEKLLDVGRRFDYAQTKGNLRAMEKAHEKSLRDDGRAQTKKQSKKAREINMKNRARERLRRQRIADAMKEKKKQKAEREKRERKEKVKADKARKKAKNKSKALELSAEDQSEVVAEKTVSTKSSDVTSSDIVNVGDLSNEQTPQQAPDNKINTPVTEGGAAPTEPAEEPSQPPSDNNSPSPNNTENATTANPPDQDQNQNPTPNTDEPPSISPSESPASPTNTPQPPFEALTKDMTSLTLERTTNKLPRTSITTHDPFSQVVIERPSPWNGFGNPSLTAPPSPISSLHDDDFPWDSDIDGPAYTSSSSSSSSSSSDSEEGNPFLRSRPRAKIRNSSSAIAPLDCFNGDPWNALLVLGLRVYSKGDVSVKVLKDGEDGEEEYNSGSDA